MKRAARDHARFLAELDRALEWAGDPAVFEARAADISAWAVGEHLEHLLLADRTILGWVEAVAEGRREAGGRSADPGDPDGVRGAETSRGGPTWRGRAVLWTGRIPRGKGRSPEFAVPLGRPRPEVGGGLREIRERAIRLEPALPALGYSKRRLRHPALGNFTAVQWLRFAGVHHAHHGKIVRDVLASG